jgi:hypothetical protein
VSGVELNESDRSEFLATCAKIILKCALKERAGMPWNKFYWIRMATDENGSIKYVDILGQLRKMDFAERLHGLGVHLLSCADP